jgi:serine/threonine protein kinase
MSSEILFSAGMVLGGAELEAEIGRGGQAQVFRASYRGKKVAMKLLLPGQHPAIATAALRRFDREQDILLKLKHENIVEVIAAGTHKHDFQGEIVSIPYLIMELMIGTAYNPANGPLPWTEVVKIGIDAARGLACAHENAIVHRDIKPGNILLNENGKAKVSDFGLAKILGSDSFSGGLTLMYASPEQHDPHQCTDHVSDIYSLGITYYEMLTGRWPFEANDQALRFYINGFAPTLPIQVRAPEELKTLIMKMISLKRSKRPQSVKEILDVLEKHEKKKDPKIFTATLPRVDMAAEEEAVRLYAKAFLRPKLAEKIILLKGQDLGGWNAVSLYAIGGEGILIRVDKAGQKGLLKMPNLPYDCPVGFGLEEIDRAREELAFEAAMLNKFTGTILPELYDFAEGKNPLLADRSERVANTEKFLVMEFIPGRALDLELQSNEPSITQRSLLNQLYGWVQQIILFLIKLKETSPGYFYTDFKPSNIRIAPDNKLFLLDAGSVIYKDSKRGVPTTPGFYPGRIIISPKNNAALEKISMVALGRTLYSSLLNQVIYEDMSYDFNALTSACGTKWMQWIKKISNGHFATIEESFEALPGN